MCSTEASPHWLILSSADRIYHECSISVGFSYIAGNAGKPNPSTNYSFKSAKTNSNTYSHPSTCLLDLEQSNAAPSNVRSSAGPPPAPPSSGLLHLVLRSIPGVIPDCQSVLELGPTCILLIRVGLKLPSPGMPFPRPVARYQLQGRRGC
jgi:hypothetical protein